MVRLESAKGSKGKVPTAPSSKGANKENSNPVSDPYDDEVTDFHNLTTVPTLKTKYRDLKKASGRFQSKSPKLSPTSSLPPSKQQTIAQEADDPEAKRKDSLKRKGVLTTANPEPKKVSVGSSSNYPALTSSKIAETEPKKKASLKAEISESSLELKKKDSIKNRQNFVQVDFGSYLEELPMSQIHSTSTKQALSLVSTADPTSTSRLLVRTSGNFGEPAKKTAKRVTKSEATRVFQSKDLLLLIAQYLPGLELVRLGLSNTRIQTWLGDANHRLWQDLCIAAQKRFRVPKRPEDSWKRRYLQSLSICEACDFYCMTGGKGAVTSCISCCARYCGFNPPPGHVRFPSTPSVNPAPPRKVGMCYEQCWTLCWRCNDLIVMQNTRGLTGPVCRTCCPPDRDVCDQCRETILLARTKPQWQNRRDEHKVARVLGLNDTTEEREFVMELEDDNRSVTSQAARYEKASVPDESVLESSTIFDPYF